MAGLKAGSKPGTNVDAWRRTIFLAAIMFAAFFAAAPMAHAQTPVAHAQTNYQAWLSSSGGHEPLAIPAPIPPSIRALGNSVLEQSAVQELQRGTAGTTVAAGAMTASAGETVVGTLDEVRVRKDPLILQV